MSDNPRNNPENKDGQENRPFIRETVINEKPATSFGRKLLYTLMLAIAFGVVAAFSFYFTTSRLEGRQTAESSAENTVSFSMDTRPEATEPSVPTVPSVPATTESPRPSDPAQPSETKWQDIAEAMISSHNLELKDIKQLYVLLNTISSRAQRALVTVTATNLENSVFQSEHVYDVQSFGVILAITGGEVLILTPYTSTMQLSENSTLSVTFADLSTAHAYIKAQDGILDMMIMAVHTSELSENTLSAIGVMTLGNSYITYAGQPVLAMGAPVGGIIKSVNQGLLTYIETNIAAEDNSISLLHSNLVGDENSRGFLISLDGYLIGWIDPAYLSGGCVTAVGISDLKSYIEHLSNGYFGGYLGIKGVPLTADLKEKLKINTELGGIYISRCLDDSPAQKAGLQNGDILVEIAGIPIQGISDLREKLLTYTTEQTISITVLRLSGGRYRDLQYDVYIERR